MKLGLTGKKFIAHWLCHPWVGALLRWLLRNRINFRGCIIHTDDQAIPSSTVASLFWGLYEKAEVMLVRSHLRTDLDVVELGSSIGGVSSHIARLLNPECKLICVEADPDLSAVLRRNLNANGGEKAAIFSGAIDYSGQRHVIFSSNPFNRAVSRVALTDTPYTKAVHAVTLHSIIADYAVTDDFVLVSDIEGAEIGFLRQDVDTLKRCQQMIIELHRGAHNGKVYEVDEMSRMIQNELGFELSSRRGNVFLFERLSRQG